MNQPNPKVDVCIVVEGCYPFVHGGVSSWIDWLIRKQPDLTFGVMAIVADDRQQKVRYPFPPNLTAFKVVSLAPPKRRPSIFEPKMDANKLGDLIYKVIRDSDISGFSDLIQYLDTPVQRGPFGSLSHPTPPTLSDLTTSYAAWTAMLSCYKRTCPEAGFLDFFWAWRTLVGGLFAVMTTDIVPARSYHAISTGFAGLLCARAAMTTGCHSAITEHGIYTNERRIDLIMADWIEDTIQSGVGAEETRLDIRQFWIETFEAFARISYQSADQITTLYGANQSFQRALGATENKLAVIPNGIELEKFKNLSPSTAPRRPTVGLIGRVVPIKDIEACIAAAALVRRDFPDVEFLIMGPTDEDEDYFALCQRRVEEYQLQDVVTFTGKININDYLPRLDLMLLTSLSEAQPLVLLEAGAARVPCVTTDVGSCREIIEGAPDEEPNFGPGGRVVPVMDTQAIGHAIAELLSDEELRAQYGRNLCQRVETFFTSQKSADRYGALYRDLIA